MYNVVPFRVIYVGNKFFHLCHLCKEKGATRIELMTYRTAADCSTTELYTLSDKTLLDFVYNYK